MPSATAQRAPADANSDKDIQLVYLCAVHSAVNHSCKTLNDIAYTSGDPVNDRHLNRLQIFLCKLAQICDTKKGGDTITALVALKGANGPEYLFTSNNRKESELNDTRKFLKELLEYVGENPVGLGEKGMSKQILWRALEFGLPKVEFYIKRVAALTKECIDQCIKYGGTGSADVLLQLQQIEARSKFPFGMLDGENSKNKFLSDCETLIKAIQSARESGFSMTIEEHVNHDNVQISRIWCELRHYLGRLHSYRQAAECIYKASRDWPDMFKGITVRFVPSARQPKLSLPRTPPGSAQVIQTAFPDLDMNKYADHIAALCEYGLYENIQNEFPKKAIKRCVHCEVHLHDFLVQKDVVDASRYWDSSMFIATSKPPCRLCHYYFNDGDNDFQVQSSHMNVYPRWRLPDLCEGHGDDAAERQEELLDDIIENMQQDTLRIIEQKMPQGKRNDSRTDSRTMGSAMSSYVDVGHMHMAGRSSGRFSAGSRGYGHPIGDQVILETSSTEDFDDEDFDSSNILGAAI